MMVLKLDLFPSYFIQLDQEQENFLDIIWVFEIHF